MGLIIYTNDHKPHPRKDKGLVYYGDFNLFSHLQTHYQISGAHSCEAANVQCIRILDSRDMDIKEIGTIQLYDLQNSNIHLELTSKQKQKKTFFMVRSAKATLQTELTSTHAHSVAIAAD